MDLTWLGIKICICWSQKPLKNVGACIRKPVNIRCQHHLPHTEWHISFELIRLLIVACGMLSHSSSMTMWSCWILTGTGRHCRTRRSRVSQTCSVGDIEKYSLTGMYIWEKKAFCVYGQFQRSFFSAYETWDQHFTCCVYIFVLCRYR